MARPSYIKQSSSRIEQAAAVQWPVPAETFQLIDPPLVSASPEKKVHRDCEVFKITATATLAAITTPTLFAVVHNDGTNPPYDLLGGGGILPIANVSDPEIGRYEEWWLVPRPLIRGKLSRVWVDVTQVGDGTTGLIFEVCFI